MMPIIKWKEIYETGIVALDNEHRKLIEQINTLFEAVRDKRGREVYDDVVAMLEWYTQEHFAHEERLMEKYHFPGLGEHRIQHQQLITSVKELKSRSGSDDEATARELLKFLRGWLLGHIVEVDKKYGVFIESRAGRFVE